MDVWFLLKEIENAFGREEKRIWKEKRIANWDG